MAEPSEDHIRLRLVTPNFESESQAPAQIMEADNEEEEEVITEPETKYVIPEVPAENTNEQEEETEEVDADNHGEREDGEKEDSMQVDENEEVEGSELEDENEKEDEEPSDLDEKDEPLSENEDLSDGEVKSPLPPLDTDDRVTLLESELKRSKARLDGFSQELKILLVEVNIVCDWITDNFGEHY